MIRYEHLPHIIANLDHHGERFAYRVIPILEAPGEVKFTG